MMGERRTDQGALFHEFSLERHVPQDHLLRAVDRFVDLDAGKLLKHNRRAFKTPRTAAPKDDIVRYRASIQDCGACALKPKRCPGQPARKVGRSIFEGARDMARDIAKTGAYVTSRRQRKKVEMLFAHLKRIVKLDRLRLRGPCGARDEFLLAATAQNLRKLAKLIPPPAQPLQPERKGDAYDLALD